MAVFKNCLQKPFLSACFSVKQVRFYARWSHRRPVRVYTPEEYETLQKQQFQKQQATTIDSNCETVERIEKTVKNEEQQEEQGEQGVGVEDFGFERITNPKTKILRKPLHKKEIKTVDMLETVIDGEGNLVYTKMGNKDTRITSLFVDLKSKKSKESMLLEGKRLIKEAILAGCKLQYVLFSRKSDIDDLKEHLPKTGAKLYKMPYREVQAWSDLTTAPGIMAIFKIPDLTKIETRKGALPLTIICDNIREPGNLGAVLRTSAGVGCQSIILTKGCADLWNSKVLRSACGAHFKIPVQYKLDWSEIRDKTRDSIVFIADNNKNNESDTLPIFPYSEIDYKMCKHITLIIGGETEGISSESFTLATEFNGCRINIPLTNDVESLNTGSALGIIAFEIRRQLIEHTDVDNVEENSLQ